MLSEKIYEVKKLLETKIRGEADHVTFNSYVKFYIHNYVQDFHFSIEIPVSELLACDTILMCEYILGLYKEHILCSFFKGQ